MMDGQYWGMGWGMWFIPLIIILVIYFLIKNNSQNKNQETPMEIIKKRYATREITKEQYEEMNKTSMNKIFYAISSLFLITACGTNQSPNQQMESSDNSVKIVGAMRNVMHKGELFGTILLDTITNKSHLYGIGSLEYLKGEILIIDGKPYVSSVITDTAMKVEENWKIKAPFFVYANIEKWTKIDFPDSIQTIPQLGIFLENISENQQRPFTFKMNATVQSGDIHIVNLSKGTEVHSPEEAHQEQRNYPIENEQVEMIGFFSTEHQGIFTHHDSYVHLHLITNDKKKNGAFG